MDTLEHVQAAPLRLPKITDGDAYLRGYVDAVKGRPPQPGEHHVGAYLKGYQAGQKYQLTASKAA
jgi:hypothetical protein